MRAGALSCYGAGAIALACFKSEICYHAYNTLGAAQSDVIMHYHPSKIGVVTAPLVENTQDQGGQLLEVAKFRSV